MSDTQASKPIGFWGCWALVVGCMIGSGIFMLPAQLAPYGMLGLVGLIVAGAGAIALALVFARQAERTNCDGGPYAYSRQAFGDLTGFLMGWAYWLSFVAGVPTVAMAFVSYLGVFVPGLATNPLGQMASGIALIAAFTFINIRGLKEMSVTQITLTVLKIIPLVAIIAFAIPAGAPANAPAFNPSGQSIFAALTLTALIALWPFTGFEVVTLPAGNVKDCERTIPRALITGMLTVVVIYLSATVAVMLLVPPAQLMHSTAPFSDAARALGPWGPGLIAAGALVATAGTINGLIFTCGQMPLAWPPTNWRRAGLPQCQSTALRILLCMSLLHSELCCWCSPTRAASWAHFNLCSRSRRRSGSSIMSSSHWLSFAIPRAQLRSRASAPRSSVSPTRCSPPSAPAPKCFYGASC
ncbi:MAG: amino acid permease [Caulobacteraceae bacterium]|nr:amino acid permease [Caulobacteraceae bacterium]